jgi:hypothetical protein
MTYAQRIVVANDDGVKNRVIQAFKAAATDILGELIGGNTEEQSRKRQELARRVLQEEISPKALVEAACTQTGVGDLSGTLDDTNPTDAVIDTAVSAVWDDLAGVTTQDKS